MIRRIGLLLALALVAGSVFSMRSVRTALAAAMEQAQGDDVPAYHKDPPKGDLPKTLDPEQFSDEVTKKAYQAASKVEPILFQQPCYCRCDQSDNHTSLLDCFLSDHGKNCDMCQQEAFYVYEQSQKGKTAAEIRQGIMDGKWKDIDLDKYRTPAKAQG